MGLLGIKTQFPYAIAAAAGDERVLHQFEGGLAKPGRVFDRAVLVRIAGVLVGRVQKRVESEKIAGTLSESEEDAVRCELMFQDDGALRACDRNSSMSDRIDQYTSVSRRKLAISRLFAPQI